MLTSLRWAVITFVARLAALMTARVSIIALEELPPEPRIFVGNHRSYYDPVLGLLAFRRIGARPSVGVSETFFHSPFGPFLRAIDAVPVPRRGGGAVVQLGSRLRQRGDVALMVEGRIQDTTDLRDSERLPGGAAVLAIETGAPIVVVAMAGADRAWPRGRKRPILRLRGRPACSVIIGQTIWPGSESADQVMDRVRSCHIS